MIRKLQQLLLGEKGQSLIEWALVSLLVVGLVYMFQESSLLPQLSNAYDNVGSYLGNTPTNQQTVSKYGSISNTELRQVDNAERIAMDDATLRNLAGAFLGKTKSELETMFMKTPNYNKYNPNGQLNQGNLLFDYYIRSTGDGENEAVRIEFAGEVVSKENLLNWMQGNYTAYASTEKQRESDQRYFFSNDLIDSHGIDGNTVQSESVWAVCVRCCFEFDNTGKVSAVQIWATRNTQKNGSNEWLRDLADGVDGKMNIRVTN